MGTIYTYREHGTGARITSDKPIHTSPSGNDVTELSRAEIPDAPKAEAPKADAAKADAAKAE